MFFYFFEFPSSVLNTVMAQLVFGYKISARWTVTIVIFYEVKLTKRE